ncbi:ABC transporter ATP-binding protein [Gloeocapsopsis dulcis]|uniref:ABC transporter ATP-binding protein n=1 Tax=Gloeocapsopsis dulcis AAB1 = 1H9 TaxID=1433147 RepID=A0A6N8FV25_9CHRO|nr:ABC transporter ATP-binding protein [Gloeocapsopsis dulcis]MUL36709.1 ABC transporter ATP-binding protein [Gloeocapsopsis dulcis AAB1 = 1H9]WNN91282.1 ABC transporter ATP-binding protein [Gloeocapsopsis dulcis]
MTGLTDSVIQNQQSINQVSLPPDLEVVNMTKRFGAMMALDNVSLHLKPGTFHALLGENGAGKSTLVKCVMGFYTPDKGDVLIDKRSRNISSPRDAHKYGIGMVYQHFTSVPAMTVAENLVLSRYDNRNLINWKAEYAHLKAFMQGAPFQVDLDTPVMQLAAGQKQKLEILKQLYLQSRILILDEPTSVLTPQEADEVLGLLRNEVQAGNLSVLMISHKFREVMAFVDEVTILRKGKFAGHGLVKDLSLSDLATMMLGERRETQQLDKTALVATTPVLEIKNIHANKDNGLTAVNGVNLTVHSGEIVGIAGVSGNGQRELVEVLAGQRPATQGQIFVNGEIYTATRAEMFRHCVFALPEEPLRNACVPHMSVAENLALRTFDRPPQASCGWLLVLKAMREAAKDLVSNFSIKTSSVDAPVGNLSGGNVQRTVLARELSSDRINLLIAANPCYGLDFGAVEYIHTQIVAARNRGVAVLLVSEDLNELLALADRIVVISEGKFVYESAIADADITTIGQCMAGH